MRGFLMPGLRAIFGFTLLTAGSLCLGVANPAPASQHHPAHKRVAKPEPVAPPAPVGPLVPLTLEQMPAMPPQVAYRNGGLSVVAQNSTLVDILRAVRTQTGASIDMPPNATERVVGRFGPGPAREVMATLLNGSHFNYVMAGSAAEPDGLQRLVLTAQISSSEATSETVAQNQVNPPPNNPFMRPRRDENGPDSTGMAEDSPDDSDSDVQAPDGTVQTGTPDQP